MCSFYIYYNKTVLGGFVRALIKKEAFSSDSACTLDMLEVWGKAFVKTALKKGSQSLMGVIEHADEKDAYYIPLEKKDKAEKMFCIKGASLLITFGSCILVLASAYLLTLVLPWIISLSESIF